MAPLSSDRTEALKNRKLLLCRKTVVKTNDLILPSENLSQNFGTQKNELHRSTGIDLKVLHEQKLATRFPETLTEGILTTESLLQKSLIKDVPNECCMLGTTSKIWIADSLAQG